MCLDTLDVNASELSTINTAWTVDVYKNILSASNANTVQPLAPDSRYFSILGRKNLVRSDTSAYAYKVTIDRTDVSASIGPEVYWMLYACGTYTELLNLSCEFGPAVTSGSPGNWSFWVVTENSEKTLSLGVVCCFHETFEAEEFDGVPAYDVNFSLDVSVTPYTRDEYENAMLEQQVITNDKLGEANALQEEANTLQEEANTLQEEANETSRGILSSITDFFGSFFQNLIDSVISVFVPDSETMKGLFDELNQFFSDTFGFLYYPFEFLIQAFDVFLNSDSSTGLTFPSFSLMGYEVWGEQTYDLGSDELTGNIFSYVRLGTGALLSLAFVNYLRNFFDKRFGGGGS